jgi:hypothetical protein
VNQVERQGKCHLLCAWELCLPLLSPWAPWRILQLSKAFGTLFGTKRGSANVL